MRTRTTLLCTILLISACAREEARVQDTAGTSAAESSQAIVRTRPNEPIRATALATARSPQHGTYLTDETGRALYLFANDSTDQSTCYDKCAVIWPPFLAVHGAIATASDSAVRQRLIGSSTRRDGTTQITYNRHPLYYYFRDSIPGRTRGQDITDQFGEWYLVSPRGDRVR